MLRPRTRDALARTRATGVHVVVVTGRMFRAVRPYLEQAQLDDLVVCYQGAVVADPGTGEFLLHVPIPLAEAREAMDAVLAAGFHLNCYVDDLLYVAEVTPEARRYADFQASRSTRSAISAPGSTVTRPSSSQSATRRRSTSSRRS